MRFVVPLLLLWTAGAGAAENLVRNGSFEFPPVSGRMLQEQGGNPGRVRQPRGWLSLEYQASGKNGKVMAGLTNEAHRDGKQSLFVTFRHVTMPYQAALLTSNFIPVAPAADYVVQIWGQIDPKDPMTQDGRSAYLKLQVDYFAKDANESVGETTYAVQPLPGSKGREAFFTNDSWKRFVVALKTPPDAVFAQLTWRWETGSDPGEMNGTMFFDDIAFVGPPAANPDMTPAPVQSQPSPATAPEAGATPAAQ